MVQPVLKPHLYIFQDPLETIPVMSKEGEMVAHITLQNYRNI